MAPNRVRPDHYKGMSPAEQQAVIQAQEAQRMMNLSTGAAAKAESSAEDAAMEATRRAGVYQDAQVAALRSQMRKKMQEENLMLAQKQYASQAFLKTKVFTNALDASFYDQFGTTSR